MKPTLLLVAISWVIGATPLLAKSEVETLRGLCAEQERQIRQLEDENAKLRSLNGLTANRSSDKTTRSAPPASTPAAAASSNAAKASNTYTVRPNDTLERVSRKFGIAPAALAGMNGLKATSTIHEGQKLKVPGTTALASATPPASTASQSANAAVVAGKTHQLKDGETFFSLGRKYGIPTATLIAANPDVKPSAMRPGQVIRLTMPAETAAASAKAPAREESETPEQPAAAEKTAAADKPTARALATSKQATPASEKATTLPVLAHKAPSPVAPPAKPITASTTAQAVPTAAKKTATPASATSASKSNIRSVTIDGTTTYGEFAAKHGTSISRLNDLNALDLVESTVLAKGSELYIPAQP